MNMIKKLKKWWDGEMKTGTDGMTAMMWTEYHWTARVARWFYFGFTAHWKIHWKFWLTFIVMVIGVVVAVIKLFSSPAG